MKRTKKNKFVILFLLIISILIILIGTYLLYLSNPKRIYGKALSDVTSKFDKLEIFYPTIGDYTISNKTKIITSNNLGEYKIKSNDYYKIITNITNNFNNTDIKFDYTNNRKNKELFINYNSKVNDENLVTGKYLVKNNTEYYYVNDLTDTYINNGNNSYFESLINNNTQFENMKYLNRFISKSFINNIDSKYFTKKSEKGLTKISLKLDNKRLNNINKKVIKDLEEDTKAKTIITGYDRDFFKKKRKNTDYLKKNENLYINIYTDNIFFNSKKYEIIYNKNKFTYKNDEFIYEYKSKKELTGKITNSERRLNISLFDSKNRKTGNLNLIKKKDNMKLVFYLNQKDMKTNLNINYNKKNINKKSYNQNYDIKLSATDKDKLIYSINLDSKSKIVPAKKIKEDTSKSQLDSSVDKETKDKLNNKFNDVYKKVTK